MSVSIASVRAPTVLNQFGRHLHMLLHQRCSYLVCTPDFRPGRVPHSSRVSLAPQVARRRPTWLPSGVCRGDDLELDAARFDFQKPSELGTEDVATIASFEISSGVRPLFEALQDETADT